MKNNSTKIVLIVLAVLAVLVLVLLVSSGGCGAQGGGGGGAAGTAPVTSEATMPEATTPEAATPEAATPEAATPAYDDDGDSYEMMRDQLLKELSEGSAPVGANARNVSEEKGDILTVVQAHDALVQRGFGDLELTANFTMDGDYISQTALDPASTEQYPSYMAYYASKNGILWMVAVNADRFFAVPVAADSGSISKQIIFSEHDTVTQYDGVRNQYSEFTFQDLAAQNVAGVTVQRIDAATLDSYTADALGRM